MLKLHGDTSSAEPQGKSRPNENQLKVDSLLPESISFARLALVADTTAEKAELLGIFFDGADASLQAMAQALQAKDSDAWRHAAHSLKGAAANLGMKRLQQLCNNAELLLVRDEAASGSFLQVLSHELRHIQQVAQRHLTQSAATP